MVIPGKKKGELTFVFDQKPGAKAVYLVGNFNHWQPHAQLMAKTKDGSFRTKVQLPAGQYEYKFLADDQWLHDPAAMGQLKNSYGTLNSIFRVV